MTTDKRIFMIDASAIRESSCMRRFFSTVVLGLKGRGTSNTMVYGSAFHKFAEDLEKTDGNMRDSLKAALEIYQPSNYVMDYKKKFLTEHHLTKTCTDYFLNKWLPERENKASGTYEVLKLNGDPQVEKKFCFPYWTCPQFDILLAGTIDKIGRFRNGVYAMGDYKTSGAWNIDEYFESYKMDPQFNVYSLYITKLAEMYPQSIYAEMVKFRLSYFIEGVFYGPSKDTEFKRSDVFHVKPARLVLFEKMLQDLVHKLAQQIVLWMAKGEPKDYMPRLSPEGELNGACKTVYGKCKFFNPCASPDEIAMQHVIRNNYEVKPYNPLEFGGGPER